MLKNTKSVKNIKDFAAKGISTYSDNELIQALTNESMALPVLNEISRRKRTNLLAFALNYPSVSNSTRCLKVIIQELQKLNIKDHMEAFYNLLGAEALTNVPSADLLTVCMKSYDTMALSVLSGKINPSTSSQILISQKVTLPASWWVIGDKTNCPLMGSIIQQLRQGIVLDNLATGSVLVNRMTKNPLDPFVLEVLKYKINPSFLGDILTATQKDSRFARARQTILSNKDPHIKVAIFLAEKMNVTHDQLLESMAEILQESDKPEYEITNWGIKVIVDEMKRDKKFADSVFAEYFKGINFVTFMIEKSRLALHVFIGFIKENENDINMLMRLHDTPGMEELIEFALQDEKTRDRILSLPKDFLSAIRLNAGTREMVQNKFNPPKEEPEEPEEPNHLSNLFANSWFNKYIQSSVEKEAGMKEGLMATLLSAVISILSGSTMLNAAQKFNVKQEDVAKALQDPYFVEYARKSMSANQAPPANVPQTPKIKIDHIVNFVAKHEGLLPKQTPFRITDPSMRKWKTIHGFPIDRKPAAPTNRKNFIFLQRAEDVIPAIEKQVRKYIDNPSRYGLPADPSLKDVLGKFDQTNLTGKINYLQSNLPGLDVNKPAKNYL